MQRIYDRVLGWSAHRRARGGAGHAAVGLRQQPHGDLPRERGASARPGADTIL